MRSYRPDEYWTTLLERDGVRQTGHAELSSSLNRWLYKNGERNLDRFLAQARVPRPERVFDAGLGAGFWVDHWYARGADRVDGCDLIPAAVARIAARRPGWFTVANLAEGVSTRQKYPFVSAMNVLLHITQDDDFARAIAVLSSLVEPGGYLLLAEPAVVDPSRATQYSPYAHARIRALNAYQPPGLRRTAWGPTAVIGADPIEGAAIWQRTWRLLRAVGQRSEWAGELAGRLVYVLDPVLLRFGWAPSGKFLLFKRD